MSKLKNRRSRRSCRNRRNVFAIEMAERKRNHSAMAGSGVEDRMIANHTDVLQNIEFALVECSRSDEQFDDAAVARALRCAILQDEPPDQTAALLIEALEDMRQFREDLSEQLWEDGLRTVLNSVQRHSNLKPGRTDYLEFIAQFVP